MGLFNSKKYTNALVSFSCGANSACALKLAHNKYGDNLRAIYCDTFKYEHPDNHRFFSEVQDWVGIKIDVIKSKKYTDIYDVFDKTGWLVGPAGARCTTELKKIVRQDYQNFDDIHILGYTFDEETRIKRFISNNPELDCDWILRDKGMTKTDCKLMIIDAGIKLPEMYKLGYKNNNCIGCVKGQSGYWNKIRIDFPEIFKKMSKQERKMNVAINKRYEKLDKFRMNNPDISEEWINSKLDKKRGSIRIPVFLDELSKKAGVYKNEPDISCGLFCQSEH